MAPPLGARSRALELGAAELLQLVHAILQRGGAECETSRAGASATEVQPLRFPTKRSKAVARGLIQSMLKPMANQRGEVCVPTPCLPEIQAVDALGSRHEGRDFKKLAVAPRRSQLIGCQAGAAGCCCSRRSMSRHCHNCMGNLFSCVFAREALGATTRSLARFDHQSIPRKQHRYLQTRFQATWAPNRQIFTMLARKVDAMDTAQ